MDGAQLHLALNHFPVILSATSVVILLWGLFSKNPEIKKLGLFLVIATTVTAGATFLTGEPAEGVLKKFPLFSETRVHEHEEAGEAALIVSIISGLVALSSFHFEKKNPKLAAYTYFFTLVVLIMSSLAFFKTAHLGGLISHQEIRSETTNAESK